MCVGEKREEKQQRSETDGRTKRQRAEDGSSVSSSRNEKWLWRRRRRRVASPALCPEYTLKK